MSVAGWYKARKKIGNSLLIFIAVIFIMLILMNISSAAGLEPPLKVAWKYRLGLSSTDIGPQSIHLIVSDIAYVDYQGLKAINVNNGKLLWSKDWSANIAYKDGVLYAARAFSPSLYALDARTGEEIWKKEYPELEDLMKNNYPGGYYLGILNDTLIILAGVYIPDPPSFDISFDPKGHYVFYSLAVDMDGNLNFVRLRGERSPLPKGGG